MMEFLAKGAEIGERVTMSARVTARNPNMEPTTGRLNWRCHLYCAGRRMIVVFTMGVGDTKPPQVADVLDCLASDSAGIENNSTFEEWCAEYGYDTDSRKSERIYNACKRQAVSLKRLLDTRYDDLLWNVERL